MPSNEQRRLLSVDNFKSLLTEKLAVNRAVVYILITRGWQFVSAPISLYLIYKFFGERQQGYYYLFPSLLATQLFFELGLNTILSLLSSHEWSRLSLDSQKKVTGDPSAISRLASLVQYGDRWYRFSMVLFVSGLLLFGPHFIRDAEDPDHYWMGPWILAVVVNGLSLAYQPRLAVLEGCNQVVTLNFYRMLQAILGSIVVWTSIINGGFLWTIAFANLTRLVIEAYLVHIHYRQMFRSLTKPSSSEVFTWKTEVWPLQWRLAIQSIGMYFTSFFFIPVIDTYHGKAAAGRMGMTWSIIITLQAASLAWTQTRIPEFGALTAQGKIEELNKKIKHIGAISIALLLTAGSMFVIAVWGLQIIKPDAADRFLEPWQIMMMIFGMSFFHISWHIHSYIRLFKRDPFLIQNTMNAVLTGAAAWHFGKVYGASGIIMSHLSINALFMVPMSSWLLCRHLTSLSHDPFENLHKQ